MHGGLACALFVRTVWRANRAKTARVVPVKRAWSSAGHLPVPATRRIVTGVTTPVHIICGFLGSGKTTLLNHCLAALPGDRRVAIIVNDFGDVAIDGQLIERGDYAMKELPSGCVCCTLAGSLAESLSALAQDERPELIVMETTGIAKPAQIALLFRYEELQACVHLGNVVCLVDSSTFPRFEQHLMVLREQVEQSNTVVLNKIDLADDATLEMTRQRVRYLSQPGALMLETTGSEIDPAIFFEERATWFPSFARVDSGNTHDFYACTVSDPAVYRLDRLTDALTDLGEQVLRLKGIVRTDAGPKLIQGTLAGLEITDWDEDVEDSKLVFIARDLPAEKIRESLQKCR